MTLITERRLGSKLQRQIKGLICFRENSKVIPLALKLRLNLAPLSSNALFFPPLSLSLSVMLKFKAAEHSGTESQNPDLFDFLGFSGNVTWEWETESPRLSELLSMHFPIYQPELCSHFPSVDISANKQALTHSINNLTKIKRDAVAWIKSVSR